MKRNILVAGAIAATLAGGEVKGQTLGGFFTDVRAVEGVNSHPWWDGVPSLSHDGNTLYFDSTRIGRKDLDSGRDLFMASRMNDGSFGDVIPLVDLNTDVNESGLVLAPDGREAYFTSTRSPNGYLHQAVRADDGRWNVRVLSEIRNPYGTHATITCDVLTMVWSGDRDIWMSTRSDRDSLWIGGVNLM